MEIRCHDCGSKKFRRSHLRLADLSKLILFQYPVRCVECYARGFTSVPAAFSIKRRTQKKISSQGKAES
jgi:hypothetical protein